jgi:hypothetical protein
VAAERYVLDARVGDARALAGARRPASIPPSLGGRVATLVHIDNGRATAPEQTGEHVRHRARVFVG